MNVYTLSFLKKINEFKMKKSKIFITKFAFSPKRKQKIQIKYRIQLILICFLFK